MTVIVVQGSTLFSCCTIRYGKLQMRALRDAGSFLRIMIVFVEDRRADDVQDESDAPNDHDQKGIFDRLEADKSLDSLQEDTDAERQQEDSVEKRAEEGGTLPAER